MRGLPPSWAGLRAPPLGLLRRVGDLAPSVVLRALPPARERPLRPLVLARRLVAQAPRRGVPGRPLPRPCPSPGLRPSLLGVPPGMAGPGASGRVRPLPPPRPGLRAPPLGLRGTLGDVAASDR